MKKKPSKRYYFTKVHENAIVQYCISNDRKERTELYVEYIGPAFNELVDKIVFTYKFSNLPNIDVLRDECKIWLTTILDKYDPNKGSKAFSYFSVITKNWFIHKVKKNSQKNRREVQFDNLSKEASHNFASFEPTYDQKREKNEFWIFFENANDIEIFNKKAVYLYLRELTGLNTKQVVNNLNKLRTKYFKFKQKWNDGKI